MRARLAIHAAGVKVELREVVLRDKPAALLALSPKATVPVLQLPDQTVLEQSFDIMQWAWQGGTPPATMPGLSDEDFALIWENDSDFKAALDRYKYADRHPEKPAEAWRAEGEKFLAQLDQRLAKQPYLSGSEGGFLDLALLPFVRQFAHVDKAWFDACDHLHLRQWLTGWLEHDLFTGIMRKYPAWLEGAEPTVF